MIYNPELHRFGILLRWGLNPMVSSKFLFKHKNSATLQIFGIHKQGNISILVYNNTHWKVHMESVSSHPFCFIKRKYYRLYDVLEPIQFYHSHYIIWLNGPLQIGERQAHNLHIYAEHQTTTTQTLLRFLMVVTLFRIPWVSWYPKNKPFVIRQKIVKITK